MNPSPQPHWLARSIGSATLTPALLVALVAFTLWFLGRSSALPGSAQPLLIALTLLAVAIGCAALAFIRPQRAGLSPPHVMLSLGFGGMLLGLLWDVLQSGPARLDSLCVQSSGLGFVDSLLLHIEFLPGMHAGMLAGGLAAIPSLRVLRPHCGRYLCSLFAQNLMCSGWMLIGMTAGAVWLARWQIGSGSSTLPGMLGGMFVGMTWGMVLSVALYRAFFAWRQRARPS
ncbi:hypothetical protein [Rhodoferax sp. BAB1]|uniref:hypothetical protein n=1 Tax=Rhodoferax sp. BAB1 TaxID=2741720 RepID=UPI0015765AD6|nr:hypothetical protein [Rhodoferax sp. BAB1]QKO22001.1 hypothetical protein HTY51_08920 [Rhodoferax sp. BAB1]